MDLYREALNRFQQLFAEAKANGGVPEPTAMTLATATAAGRSSARTVLLKAVDERGFVFYTNTLSRKGRQLAENPQAALTFFWPALVRQVLVEGAVTPVAPEEADAYFASRPRLSQAGAWASQQSQLLDSKETLVHRLGEVQERYQGQDIPRPPHWSGFRLAPDLIEFWHGRDGRLHDRDRYWRESAEWRHSLLNP